MAHPHLIISAKIVPYRCGNRCIPDADLRQLPFAALYDGQRHLIEQYAVAVTPGLTILGPKKRISTVPEALLAGLSISSGRFSSLPQVRQELNDIQTILPKTETLKDEQFTPDRWRDRLLRSSATIFHIATHGQFGSTQEETFLLAVNGEKITASQLDRMLQARNAQPLPPLQLLVFSAGQTAKDDRRATLGLAEVAIRAGAFATLGTLWAVNNASTAELMKNFYTYLRDGSTKAKAFQQAQLSLLKSDRNLPYYWAPFLLVGNWL